MIAVYRRVPLHFGRLFRVRVVMGRHDDTDYDGEIWKGRQGGREEENENRAEYEVG